MKCAPEAASQDASPEAAYRGSSRMIPERRLEAISKLHGGVARAATAVEPGAESSFGHRGMAPPSWDQEIERLTCSPATEF